MAGLQILVLTMLVRIQLGQLPQKTPLYGGVSFFSSSLKETTVHEKGTSCKLAPAGVCISFHI
jgi:hypothetical protein